MQNTGIACIRILVGLLIAYHGIEVFEPAKMTEYAKWEMFKNNRFGLVLVYFGKGSEFVGGLLLALGLFSRIAAGLIAVAMFSICFFVGNGKFWYADQHPFLFALLALVYMFLDETKWSIDNYIKK